MQIHELKRKTPNRKSKTVGRGGKFARTGGRGQKGQNSRAGHKKRPEIRDMIKKIPKMRGRGVNSNKSIQAAAAPVSIDRISANYKNGETVSPETLLTKGLISKFNGKMPSVKILSGEAIDKKVTVSNCEVSAKAKELIEKAGGKVE